MKHWDRPFPCLITDPNSNAEPGRGMAENWEEPLLLSQTAGCNYIIAYISCWLWLKVPPKTGPLDSTG